MTKHPVELGPVQETLLIPLYARAAEASKSKPLVRDPKAAEIVASLDFDFSKLANARRTLFGCCLRGMWFDDCVRAFLADWPDGTIVELGVGLNSRFDRLDNGIARWLELDLPDTIALRRRFFTESHRRTFVSSSLLEPDWLSLVPAGPVLFVAEAVLIYLPLDDVRHTLRRFADQFPDGQIAFDSVDALMFRKSSEDSAFRHVRGRLAWHLEDVHTIEQWDARYRLVDIADMGEVGRRHVRELPLSTLIFGKFYSLIFRKTAKSYRLHRLSWSMDRTLV